MQSLNLIEKESPEETQGTVVRLRYTHDQGQSQQQRYRYIGRAPQTLQSCKDMKDLAETMSVKYRKQTRRFL